jgi:hypothetical protein
LRCPVAGLSELLHRDSTMRRMFVVATLLLGLASAQAQTAVQSSGQTSGTNGASAASDPLAVPMWSLPSAQFLVGSGASIESGMASGTTTAAAESTNSSGAAPTSGSSSQSAELLPGEIPAISTQAPSTTAAAPSAPPPVCGPSVPTTDGDLPTSPSLREDYRWAGAENLFDLISA